MQYEFLYEGLSKTFANDAFSQRYWLKVDVFFCVLFLSKLPSKYPPSAGTHRFNLLIQFLKQFSYSSLGTPIRNLWTADPNALLDLYLLPDSFFFIYFFLFLISERGKFARDQSRAVGRVRQYIALQHLFLIFGALQQQLLCHLHHRTFLLIGEHKGDPASTYLCNLRNFLQNEVDICNPKFAICASCLTVKRAYFSIMDLILLMLDLVTQTWVFLDRDILDWSLIGTEFCKPY